MLLPETTLKKQQQIDNKGIYKIDQEKLQKSSADEVHRNKHTHCDSNVKSTLTPVSI